MSAAIEPIRRRRAGHPHHRGQAGRPATQRGAELADSEAAIARQHDKGRQTARERVEQLLDPGSFVELDALVRHRSTNFGMEARRPFGDGVVTGTGTIDGRPVAVFSQDATVFGGSLGEVYGEKIVKVMDLAVKIGCPMIGINDGGGARIQEGVVALGLYGEIFMRNVRSSGVVPQISLIMGAVRGRRGVLPRDHRLHRDGRPHQPHVHHRPGRDQDGDRRGGRLRGPRRRPGAQHQVRGRALPGRGRGRRVQLRQGAAELPAVEQPVRAAVVRVAGADRGRDRGRAHRHRPGARRRSSRTRRTCPTTSTR